MIKIKVIVVLNWINEKLMFVYIIKDKWMYVWILNIGICWLIINGSDRMNYDME